MKLTSLLRRGVNMLGLGKLIPKSKGKKQNQPPVPERTIHVGGGNKYSFGSIFHGTYTKRKLKNRKRRRIANASKRGKYLAYA